MKPPFIEAAIRAEIKRARAVGRDPNRINLRRETGLSLRELEHEISRINRESKGD